MALPGEIVGRHTGVTVMKLSDVASTDGASDGPSFSILAV